mgnify:CR=1 FL=1
MTTQQLTAARTLLSLVLPAPAQVETQDTTERPTSREEIAKLAEQARQQIIANLKPEEVESLLKPVASQSLIESEPIESEPPAPEPPVAAQESPTAE